MKTFLILSLIAVLTIPAFSQEKSDVSTEKNVLKINTLSLFLGTGSILHLISGISNSQLKIP